MGVLDKSRAVDGPGDSDDSFDFSTLYITLPRNMGKVNNKTV